MGVGASRIFGPLIGGLTEVSLTQLNGSEDQRPIPAKGCVCVYVQLSTVYFHVSRPSTLIHSGALSNLLSTQMISWQIVRPYSLTESLTKFLTEFLTESVPSTNKHQTLSAPPHARTTRATACPHYPRRLMPALPAPARRKDANTVVSGSPFALDRNTRSMS